MGFAGLTGLPMATRSGDVPVDAIFYLLRAKKYSLEELETALYARAGLLGLSGESGDMRLLQHSENPQAKLSVDYLVHAMTKFVGAYAAILGGLDALIFTAGIGENSPIVRAKLCRRLAWLGLELDEAANAANGPRISTAASRVSAFVIPTDEELMIALHTLELTRAA
jgi:acetate kinase